MTAVVPATPASASASSFTLVSTPVPTLKARSSRAVAAGSYALQCHVGYGLLDGDTLTGVAYGSLACSRGIEVSIFVHPDYRRQGIATALGADYADTGPPKEAVRAFVGELPFLLVLDNFEQVIEAAVDIADIVPHNPKLTVIITSQRPLQIDGERVVRLAPLEVPGPNDDMSMIRSIPSVQLLIDRAIDQDAQLEEALNDSSTTQAIAEICRRLNGLPLAIELAASRLSSLTPEVVVDQLKRGQHILSSQRRDTPERQRTMHGAIQWSFRLLPPGTQRVFLWLGAFSSGFDLAIVDRVSQHLGVSSPSFDTISELINLSMIQRVRRGTNPWYEMLESIRDFWWWVAAYPHHQYGNRSPGDRPTDHG